LCSFWAFLGNNGPYYLLVQYNVKISSISR